MNDIRNMRRGALIRWEWIILWVLISCYAVTFSYYSIQTHNSFSTGYDLANADQTIWNSAYGQFFSLSSKGKLLSRLTIHADFILAVLAPIYLVWDDVRMLLIIQSVFLALGAIPTFLIGQYVLKNNLYALVIAVLYLLNPNMQWTNMYDFHGVALAIPLLLFTFYFALRKQWKWYALFAFFSILTKEEIPLMIAMIGLYIFFFLKNKKVGLISFLFGVSWFCIVVFIVMPYVRGGQEHWVFAWYQLSGPETEGDLPKTPFVQEIAYRLFFATDVRPYYFSLLKPFGIFVPLFGIPILLLSVPEMIINTLSTHAEMRGTMLHYDSGITPFVVIATIFGFRAILHLVRQHAYLSRYGKMIGHGVMVYLLVIALRVHYPNTPLPYSPNCWCAMYTVTEEDKAFDVLLSQIPQTASITSSPEIRPHITHRRHSFTLPRHTDTADYIAIIDQNRLVGDSSPKQFELSLIASLSANPSYQLVNHTGHFYLFKNLKRVL